MGPASGDAKNRLAGNSVIAQDRARAFGGIDGEPQGAQAPRQWNDGVLIRVPNAHEHIAGNREHIPRGHLAFQERHANIHVDPHDLAR